MNSTGKHSAGKLALVLHAVAVKPDLTSGRECALNGLKFDVSAS